MDCGYTRVRIPSNPLNLIGGKMKLFRVAFIFFILAVSFSRVSPVEAEITQGLTTDVYVYDQSALPEHTPTYTLCSTITDTAWTSVANINHDFDNEYGGIVAGCQSDFVMVHYYGYITLPVDGTITFQSWADDGFYLTINDTPVIDEWVLKGCSGGTGTHQFEAGISQKIDAWFYEYGGGACNRLYYATSDTALQPIPDSAFSREPQAEQKPYLNEPTNLVGTVDGVSVTLVWDVPLETATRVERYAVMWTIGEQGWGIGNSSNSLTLADLPENTEITFRVRADNDTDGVYSQYSQPITLTTGTKPIIIPPIDPPIDPPVEPPVEPEPPVIVPPIEPEPTPEEPVKPDTAPEPVEKPVEPEPPVESPVSVANLKNLVPSEMTDKEVSLLKELALEVFETAEEGSPEYEQALEALLIVAQADDIQLDPAIASIPLVGNIAGALTDSLNFFGNAGADMAPATREKAEKVVISAVIVGQIALLAMPVPTPMAPPVAPPTPSATLNRKTD